MGHSGETVVTVGHSEETVSIGHQGEEVSTVCSEETVSIRKKMLEMLQKWSFKTAPAIGDSF